MSAYGFTLSEEERQQMATFCRLMLDKLIDAPLILNAAKPQAASAPSLQSPAAASRSKPTENPPMEQRDRWAKDRKGIEAPNYKAELRTVRPWKTEQFAKFLKVTWESTERGHVDANCFDSQLWPWIAKAEAEGAPIGLHIVRKGDYLNIVGVRA